MGLGPKLLALLTKLCAGERRHNVCDQQRDGPFLRGPVSFPAVHGGLMHTKPQPKLALALVEPTPRVPNRHRIDHVPLLCDSHSSDNARRINALCMVSTMHNEDWRGLKTEAERLQWARRTAGFENATEAAEALGMTGSAASTYYGHEGGSRSLMRAGARYAEFFRVSFDWLMRGKGAPRPQARRSANDRSVPIVGRVGAGPEGAVIFDAGADLGSAPAPPGVSDATVAVRVEGSSMRPIAYDGWLVYYEERRGGLTSDLYGQPCVIGLASGHTVIKIPYPGSKRGLFNLESANPAVDTLRDQRIKWAAPVTAIIPRRAAMRLAADVRGEASV